ncbi:MAG TPA: phage tail length tape measure family protein [Novosphingobium sp.]|nr:phage tail length tape measure family protein [Novosphingobium sp.]
MATGTVFPAFLRLQYDDDGSAKSKFLAEVDALASSGERRMKEFSTEASRQIDAALSTKRTGSGALDLGVGELRASAAAQQARAIAAREVANATALAAREQGDYSQQTRLAIAATQAQAREEEVAAAKALSHAAAVEQVQQVLARQSSATAMVVQSTRRGAIANDNATRSFGAQRAAAQQLSYQLSDVAMGFSLGVAPMTIFAQQGSQVVQAIGLMSNGSRGLAGFMGGPWGAAIIGGASILGMLIPKLLDAKNATDSVTFASYALGDAQSILGGVMDMATGKINTQSAALIALARAQLVVARIQSRTRQAEARSTITDLGTPRNRLTGSMMGFAFERTGAYENQVTRDLLSGVNNSDEAVRRLQSLRTAGKITEETFVDLASAVANFGVETANQTVFADAEKLLNGTGGRNLLKPDKARKPRASRSGGDKGLGEFGEDAAAKIQRIRDQFSDIPSAVRQANDAVRQLDDVLSDLERRKPAGFKGLVKDVQAAKGVIDEAFGRPFREMIEEQERSNDLQRLTTQGRYDEADALGLQYRLMDMLGAKDAESLQIAMAKAHITQGDVERMERQLQVSREQAKEDRIRSGKIQDQLQQIAGIRNSLVQTLIDIPTQGVGAIGGFFNRLQQQFEEAFANNLIDKIFGNAFLSAEDQVTESHRVLAAAGVKAAEALNTMANAATAGPGAANDNPADKVGQDILAIGRQMRDYSDPRKLFSMVFEKLGSSILGPDLSKKIGKSVGDALQGAAYGRLGAGLVLGAGGNNAGSAIGGAFGESVFKKVVPQLFKKLGDFAGPLGSIAGGILGGIIGGLFSKAKTGSASSSGGAVSLGGNNSAARGAAGNIAGGIDGSIAKIVERLGGTLGSYGYTIGTRKDEYRVSGSAGGDVTSKNPKGLLYKGKDAEEAARIALLNAIQDGAVQGIRAGAQRLLQAGKDIESAVQKALDFQGVFDRLKAYKDPVGAALDTLNREFTKLKTLFGEAGASAEEYAQLEELYGIERAKAIKDASSAMISSLKSLRDELMMGDNGLSLRDRKANAQVTYDALAARVKAGDVTAYDDFASIAKILLDLERQISGSQSGYFDLYGAVIGMTNGAIGSATAIADAAAGRDSPFSKSSVPSNDNQGVIDALAEIRYGIAATNQNLGIIIAQNASAGSGGYAYQTSQNYF